MNTLGLLGCTLGPCWAMSGPYWGSVGGLGCTWVHLGSYGLGFKFWGLGFDDHNAYLRQICQGYEMSVVCYMLLDVHLGQR